MKAGSYAFPLITIVFLAVIAFVSVTLRNKTLSPQPTQSPSKPETCQVHACGAIDPVSDPKYNMKEIAKQSLMLEDHLVEKNKRCKDCQAKHFLMIIGLSEEALSLAGVSISSYPMMADNPAFYNKLFDEWLLIKDSQDDAAFLRIADALRARRKALIETYVLTESNT